MSVLPKPLDIPVWGVAGRTLHFERTEDVIRWAEDEVKNWTFELKPQSPPLLQALDTQRNSLTAIANYARQLEPALEMPQPVAANVQQQIGGLSSNLNAAFAAIAQGSILTTEHRCFKFIAELAEKDIDASATLLIASRSTAGQTFANMGTQAPLAAIARMAVGIAEGGDNSRDIIAYRNKLASLNNDAEKALASIRTTLDDEVVRSQGIEQEHSVSVKKQSDEWDTLLEKCRKEWGDLKDVYDTQLGLRAPSEYWTNRAKQYRTLGWRFAWGFLGSLALFLALFVHFGIPALKPQPLQSTWVTILPVVIPAFAGLWILRILGRQLSESLAIMKDAQERVTLVTTFLALMREESTGKAVAKDEDRALILSALFRQSRVTAVDDSPPINIFDALLKARGP